MAALPGRQAGVPAVARTWRRAALASTLLVVMTAVAGCGYALAGRGSFLPSYIRVVGIPPVQNSTAVARLEQIVTERIRDEFIGRGKYTVVPDAAGADAVLRGEITSFTFQPVSLTDQQLGSRYLVTMVMKMSFTDTKTSEVLWSNDALTFREEYDLGRQGSVDSTTFIDQLGTSLERMGTDVARTVVTAITEAF